MFDIGHLYMICYIYAPIKMVQDIFHLTEDQFHRVWDAFATAYSGKEDHRALDAKAGKFALLDLVVRINFQRPNFLENIFFRLHARKLIKRFFR